MTGGFYTADVDATLESVDDQAPEGGVDEATADDLAAVLEALEAVDWREVPTVSAGTASLFAGLLRDALERDVCPICGSHDRTREPEEVEPGRTVRVSVCGRCGYPIGLAAGGEDP